MPDVPFLLTSAAAVRSFFGTTATIHDTEINALLYSISDAIARHCNRARGTAQYVEQKARTEDHDVSRHQREFWLRAVPVSTLTSVSYDEDRDFGSGTALDTDDYEVDLETGRVRVRYSLHAGSWPDRFQGAARFIYTGGLATSLQALRSYAPVLELAEQMWIKDIISRQYFGPSQGSLGGGGRSRSLPAMVMPEIVKHLLAPYVIEHLGRP